MELLSKSPYSVKLEIEVKRTIGFIKAHNYLHPAITWACEQLQITPDQLLPKSLHEFEDPNLIGECQQIRYKHYENKRKAKEKYVATYIAEKGLLWD